MSSLSSLFLNLHVDLVRIILRAPAQTLQHCARNLGATPARNVRRCLSWPFASFSVDMGLLGLLKKMKEDWDSMTQCWGFTCWSGELSWRKMLHEVTPDFLLGFQSEVWHLLSVIRYYIFNQNYLRWSSCVTLCGCAVSDSKCIYVHIYIYDLLYNTYMHTYIHDITLHKITVLYVTEIASQYVTVPYSTLQYIPVRYVDPLHYIPLHYFSSIHTYTYRHVYSSFMSRLILQLCSKQMNKYIQTFAHMTIRQ